MERNSRKYELSVWSGLDLLNRSRKETKVAVIGSSENQSPLYAYDIHYVPNINGQKKLTFSMRFLYEDEELVRRGEDGLIDNPFCALLANEARVKLYFQGEWNEFIIRSQEKDRKDYEVQYTCEDAYALELSKTGYSIELSSEIFNNTGTVRQLAEYVLDGTDWRYSPDSDIPVQYVTEPLYRLTLNKDVTFKRMGNDAPLALKSGAVVYSFYDTIMNERPFFQMLYKEPNVDFKVDDDNILIDKTNYYLDNVTYQSVGGVRMPSFCGALTLLPKFRGARTVRKQESKYDPVAEEVVKVYKGNDGARYYGYTKNNYVVDDIITNYFTNPSEFVADSSKLQAAGWKSAKGTTSKPITTVQPNSTVKMSSLDYAGYVQLDAGTYINSGITDHILNIPEGGITAGEKYVFRACFGARDGNVINTGLGRIGLKLTVAWYNILTNELEPSKIVFQTDITTDDTVYPYGYEVSDTGAFSQKALTSTYNKPRYAYGVGTFTSPISKKELISGKDFGDTHYKIGLFVTAGATAYVKDIQFFKYVESVRKDYPIIPGAQSDLVDIQTIYYFYKEPDDSITDKNQIVYSTSDLGFYTPVYDEAYQKKMSVEASKTTRFDIIQSICETFQVWAKFDVKHDKNGYVLYSGNRQDKNVVFKNDIGQYSNFGFRYGRDIQSISRTVDSDEIASKVFVEDIESTAAEGTICSIQKADMNPIGEKFLYNFSYYINQGMIDEKTLNNDLYNPKTGYYTQMKKLTNESRKKLDRYSSIDNDIAKAKSNKTVYEQYADDAENEYQKAKNYFEATVKKGTLETYPLSDTDSQDARNYYAQAMYAKQTKESAATKAKSYTALYNNLVKERDKLKYELVDKKNPNSIVSKKTKLKEAFESKYQNYIQEGTWQSDNYLDSDLYYLTAASVAEVSARPEVSYQLDVVALSALPEHESLKYFVGDIVTVEDEEYFGYTITKYGTRTPKKEKIIINEIDYNLSEPDQDKITVQNYRDKFESLFSRISAATKQLEYNQKAYAQAAESFNSDGTIVDSVMRKTLANGEIDYSSYNQTIRLNDDGITVSSPKNTKRLVRISAGGVYVSNTSGETWSAAITGAGIATELLSAGVINADTINIRSGDDFAFKWNRNGIHSFSYTQDKTKIDYNTYVRMDRYGLYGIQNGPKITTYDASGTAVTADASDWVPKDLQDLKNHAQFGFTWNGFFMKNKYNNGYVSIDNDSDIRVVQVLNGKETEKIRIGALQRLGRDVTKFGINIFNDKGEAVFETNDNGDITISGVIYASAGEFTGKIHASSGEFNGKVVATEGEFNGAIYGQYGQIPGQLIIGPKPGEDKPLAETRSIVINGGAGCDYTGKPMTPGTGLNDVYIGSANFNFDNGVGWQIRNGGDAIFNNIVARGAIRTAVFEYSEIQAIGGAILIRPASTIKSHTLDGDNIVLTVEHPEVFKDGEIVKVSTYNANGTNSGILDTSGTSCRYKITKTKNADGREVITLLGANEAPTQYNPVTLRGVDGLDGGSIISFGSLRKQGDPKTNLNNYGIGLNSGDNSVGLPRRSISLFNIDNMLIDTGEIVTSYDFQAIVGVLPQIYDTSTEYKDHLQGRNGIYSKNMYIGNERSYLSFSEETGKLKIVTDELEVTSGLDSQFEAEIFMERQPTKVVLTALLYDNENKCRIENTVDKPSMVMYTWYRGDSEVPFKEASNSPRLELSLEEANYDLYSVSIEYNN